MIKKSYKCMCIYKLTSVLQGGNPVHYEDIAKSLVCSGLDDFWGERILELVVYKYEEQSWQRVSLCMQQREHTALVPNVLVRMPSQEEEGTGGTPVLILWTQEDPYTFSPLCLTNVVILLAIRKFGKY